MRRLFTRLALLAALTMLGSSAVRNFVEPTLDHRIVVRAIALEQRHFVTAPELRFLEGWALESDDGDFGGLSGLLPIGNKLLAVSDKGALLELEFAGGTPLGARVRPLPHGCGEGAVRLQRDTESLARDQRGNVWLGYEYRNAICRLDPTLTSASALAQPDQMRGWPHTGGPEAMTQLRDGRMVVLAERPPGQQRGNPMLVFDRDPTVPGAQARELRYFAPRGYRPTDIAELPDGQLIIVHRRFRIPFNFSTIVSVLPAAAFDGDQPLRSRAIALLKAPGVHDNFEGMTVEQRDGRTLIWLVSDDNFSPLQKTYLLKFELSPD